MRSINFAIIISFLLLVPVFQAEAQTTTQTFDLSDSPQWARDLRRWNIVAFGSFPFAMFNSTLIVDLIRWNEANGMDFSAEGRRYAPWPLTSAGAVPMTTAEFERTVWMAVGMSLTVAFTDLLIVNIRRRRERRRIEAMPTGEVIITRMPHGVLEEETEPPDTIYIEDANIEDINIEDANINDVSELDTDTDSPQ